MDSIHERKLNYSKELTIFDILTRPAPELTNEESEEVKKVAHQLLSKLQGLLVLGWRQIVGNSR